MDTKLDNRYNQSTNSNAKCDPRYDYLSVYNEYLSLKESGLKRKAAISMLFRILMISTDSEGKFVVGQGFKSVDEFEKSLEFLAMADALSVHAPIAPSWVWNGLVWAYGFVAVGVCGVLVAGAIRSWFFF